MGRWIADARRFYACGDMDEERIAQLEKLGMIWSHYDVAWEESLAAARGWAKENGHLLAPTNVRDCKSFGVTPDHGGCIDDQ
ncbi:hypothetical protein [Streptomyces griseomycini]|uniref:hypothetical protein n=1 Tax=Streptomyces griseomycini TaxID=66895 RepID=UPI0040578FA5